jgi:hypothetical protein
MAYVPGCSTDVFISYAHNDNKEAWVTRLKERLATELASFLTDRVQVWFDDRIRPGVYFEEEIQQKLKNTPIFIAVISPSFLESTFCMRSELEWFQLQGGKDIIQLVKVPLEPENLEVPLPQAQYIKLYDETDQRLLTGNRLDKVLSKVVLGVKERLRECLDARPKIFVAQIRDEASRAGWDSLKDSLHEEGYAVVPAQVLIGSVPDRTIQKWLENARLSVHFGGAHDDSLARRQLEVAKRLGRPLIILDTPPRSEDVHAILTEVHARLEAQRSPALYCIFDHHSDGPRVSSLNEQIKVRTGLDVVVPEAGEKYHKYRLQTSDGILLFRCEAPDEWLQAQEQALVQSVALRGKRVVPVARYFAHSGDPASVRMEHGQPTQWTIQRTGDINVGDLQEFFDALRTQTSTEVRQQL